MNFKVNVKKSGFGPMLLLEWLSEQDDSFEFVLRNNKKNGTITLLSPSIVKLEDCMKYIQLNS